MKKLIVANWKMNPATHAEAEDILAKIDEFLANNLHEVQLVVCPPFLFLDDVAARLTEGNLANAASLGAQDLAARDMSAQTGEVSAEQLVSLGVRYVIVGHSERRAMGESEELVHAKLLTALHHGLLPILCVSDSQQVRSAIVGLDGPDLARLCIAYEPLWAISTTPGATPDTPDNAARTSVAIRAITGSGPRVLYGGSITDTNARSFLHHEAFDGVLVGGASVRSDEFVRILAQAR